MNCMDCRQKLGAYLDGELSETEHREIQEHLAVCEACALELAHLEKLSGLSKEALPQAPNDAYFQQLPDRIVSRIRPERAREPRWRVISSLLKKPAFYRAAGVVAAAALVLVVSTIVIERGKLSTSPEMVSEEYPHTLGMVEEYSALKKEIKTIPRKEEKDRELDKLAAESGPRLKLRAKKVAPKQSNRVLPVLATGSEKNEMALHSIEPGGASPLSSPSEAGAAMPMAAAQDKASAALTKRERQLALTDTIRALAVLEKLLKTEKDSAHLFLTYHRLLAGIVGHASSTSAPMAPYSVPIDEEKIKQAAELYERLVVQQNQVWLRSEALSFYERHRPVLLRLLGEDEYSARISKLKTETIP